jgi:hypothetical protein
MPIVVPGRVTAPTRARYHRLPAEPAWFIDRDMRACHLAVLGAVLGAAVVGCAGADAMTAPAATATGSEPPNVLGLHPGETMAFEVHLAGVLAGEAQLAVGDIGDVSGKPAIVVRSRAATAGAAALVKKISDEAITTIDVATGHPLTLDSVVENNGKRTVAAARFAGSSASVTYQRTGQAQTQTKVSLPNGGTLLDAHTAMAHLRGWRAAAGDRRTVYVIGGRRLWRIDVTSVGIETIGSALGNRRTIVFAGKSYRARPNLDIETAKPARTFTVWLSDDADRVPLKVSASTELGDIVMDLTDYSRP